MDGNEDGGVLKGGGVEDGFMVVEEVDFGGVVGGEGLGYSEIDVWMEEDGLIKEGNGEGWIRGRY